LDGVLEAHGLGPSALFLAGQGEPVMTLCLVADVPANICIACGVIWSRHGVRAKVSRKRGCV
jgi:hypothetical protein